MKQESWHQVVNSLRQRSRCAKKILKGQSKVTVAKYIVASHCFITSPLP